MFPVPTNLLIPAVMEQHCHAQRCQLPDDCCSCCACHAHIQPENKDGVQDDVQQCTSDLRNGGKIGSAGSLQKTLINRIANAAERADTADSQILLPHFLAECIPVRLHSDERSGSENAEQKKNRINTDGKKNTVSGNAGCLFKIAFSQRLGQQGVDSDTSSHAYCNNEQLDGIGIRQRQNRCCAVFHVADKNGIHNIVYRL